ncbi:MAG: PilZ domain-containing protein [Proteobacteria bacterium]|nr:PilZ domain-containing protein [Pseudomonadota bacterium]MBU1736979.1 PilZ domain-containing protein [Pseudomonadota bacterium]
MSEKELRGSTRKDSLNLLDYVVLDESGEEMNRAMARTLNVSTKGILLETHVPFDIGQNLEITLGLENDLVEVRGRVVRCESGTHEGYHSGVEFLEIGPSEMVTLQKFLTAFNEKQQGSGWL